MGNNKFFDDIKKVETVIKPTRRCPECGFVFVPYDLIKDVICDKCKHGGGDVEKDIKY